MFCYLYLCAAAGLLSGELRRQMDGAELDGIRYELMDEIHVLALVPEEARANFDSFCRDRFIRAYPARHEGGEPRP